MGGMFGGLFDEGGPMGGGAGFSSDEEHHGGMPFGAGTKRPRPQKVEVELKLRLEDLYRCACLPACLPACWPAGCGYLCLARRAGGLLVGASAVPLCSRRRCC